LPKFNAVERGCKPYSGEKLSVPPTTRREKTSARPKGEGGDGDAREGDLSRRKEWYEGGYEEKTCVPSVQSWSEDRTVITVVKD